MKKTIIILGVLIVILVPFLSIPVKNISTKMDLLSTPQNYISTNPEFPDTTKIRDLYGFYSPYDTEMRLPGYDPEDEIPVSTTTCSAFTVINGDQELISHFTNLVKRGNTINHIDKNTQMLVLNIDIKNYPYIEKRKLITSNKESPIHIRAKIKPESERDGHYCTSLIELTNES